MTVLPWVFCISACLVSRGTNGLCSELWSKGYLFSKQPWKIEIVSPSKAEYWLLANIIKYNKNNKNNISHWGKGQASLLAAYYTRLGFPKLGSQLWRSPTTCAVSTWFSSVLPPWELGANDNLYECEADAVCAEPE